MTKASASVRCRVQRKRLNLKDTKYTERNIRAQQSTRDTMNTAASMIALPLSPLLPLPAGSSLAAEASVSSPQSATVRRNRVIRAPPSWGTESSERHRPEEPRHQSATVRRNRVNQSATVRVIRAPPSWGTESSARHRPEEPSHQSATVLRNRVIRAPPSGGTESSERHRPEEPSHQSATVRRNRVMQRRECAGFNYKGVISDFVFICKWYNQCWVQYG